MEQAEGYTPIKVRATIVTNKPTEEIYQAHKNWLIENGTNEKIIPEFKDVQEIFDLEIKSFKAFGIEVDDSV